MLNPFAAAPSLMTEWIKTSRIIDESLDPSLAELVKIRASQINGCANCVNMHTIEARKNGESEQRLYLLSVWAEAPCFTPRERAALAWTEALAKLSERPDCGRAYENLERHFSQEEQIKITLLINVISGFNRIAVGFGLYAEPVMIERMAKAVPDEDQPETS